MSSGLVFPKHQIIRLDEIDSTNKYAERLLESTSLPEGSIIYTENQTSGVGQGSNSWESQPGKNLTATLILTPEFLAPQDQFYLTIVLSLSVCDVIDHLAGKPVSQVKWPNDIYCSNRKIAGLLIKNYVMGNSISTSIAGLGLNINQVDFLTVPFATSLKLLLEKEFSIFQVLTEWHERIAIRYNSLKSGKQELLREYLSKLFLFGTIAEYVIHGKKVSAAIIGIDEHGQLQLKDQANNIYTCGLKEVVFPFIR